MTMAFGERDLEGHIWRFFRAGGLDQVLLREAGDLEHLDKLEYPLWVALSCPVQGLELDSKTLGLMDGDHDGRIRIPEVLAAVRWISDRIAEPKALFHPDPGDLPLAQIKVQTEEGKKLLAVAKRVLLQWGKREAERISVAEVEDNTKIFEGTRFNGDGVVCPEAAEDPALAKVMEEIIKTHGSEKDRGGKPGINQKQTDAFFLELEEYQAWLKKGESGEVAVLGGGTEEAHKAFEEVRGKIEDYFARCRLASFDERGAALLNGSEADFQALACLDLSTWEEGKQSLPLQRVAPDKPLDFKQGTHPAWEAALGRFKRLALDPLLGPQTVILDETAWNRLKAALGPYGAWKGEKKDWKVGTLDAGRVGELLGGDFRDRLKVLIGKDQELAPEYEKLADLARLIRYYRDLGRLLRNFVSFSDFYAPDQEAIFQAGTLFLDQRAFSLCVRIEGPAGHLPLGTLSYLFLMYGTCTRPSGEQMNIVAALTQGDADYIMVGRRGVFIDRQGRDWDVTITQVLDNPVSLRQAFWAPHKKFIRMVEEQIAKFASSKEKSVQEKAALELAEVSQKVVKEKEKQEFFDIAKFAGIFAAIALAVGAIGGALAAFVAALSNLEPHYQVLAIAGMILAISAPSLLLAYLKLRLRSLGPLLEGAGWAINGRVKINLPLGHTLTRLRTFPPNAKRSLFDPFEDKKAKRRRIVLGLIFLLAVGFAVFWFVIKPRWLDESLSAPAAPPAAVVVPVPPAQSPPPAMPPPKE